MSGARRLLPVLLAPVLALALGGCGDGTTDRDAITKIITDAGRDRATLCDHLSDGLLARLRGVDACRRAARADTARGGRITVDRLDIKADAAVARITGHHGRGTITFVKDHGSWKVDDTTGGAR